METKVCTKDQASQTEDVNRLKDLKDEIATLKKEIESLSKSISEASTKPKFDILNVDPEGNRFVFPRVLMFPLTSSLNWSESKQYDSVLISIRTQT